MRPGNLTTVNRVPFPMHPSHPFRSLALCLAILPLAGQLTLAQTAKPSPASKLEALLYHIDRM